MNIVFHSNLDAVQHDIRELNDLGADGMPLPRKGEKVAFFFKKGTNVAMQFSYELQVIDVVYNYKERQVVVELHIAPPHRSIQEWEEWFQRHRNGRQ